MNEQSAIHPAAFGERSWERALRYLVWGATVWVAYLGLNVAVASKGLVPGYDALTYLNAATRIHLVFAGGQWATLSDVIAQIGLLWREPFTNTLDILLLVLLYDFVDYHVGIWLIHTGYIVLFIVLLSRTFDATTTALVVLWSLTTTQFLHQYTQFISEMKVGMFLVLFIVYLFQRETTQRSRALILVTILLLLFRAINILFILPLVVAYVAIRWREGAGRNQVIAGLMPIGLAILILSPVLIYEGPSLIHYVYKSSYSGAAQNWKDMSGISDKWSLLDSYRLNLLRYQQGLVVMAGLTVAGGLILYLTSLASRLVEFRNHLIAGIVVFAVLMQAQTTNIMVAYWLYMVLGLAAVAVVRVLAAPAVRGLMACLLFGAAVNINYASFAGVKRSLALQKPVTELANGLVQTIAGIPRPVIFQNYAGIGPLDFQGLEVAARRRVSWEPIDNISYSTTLRAYVALLASANVAFIANKNFMWPTYVGVNQKTEKIAAAVIGRAPELGFTKSARVYYDSGKDQYIDVYLRPTVKVNLKYASFDDQWLDQETTVVVSGANDTNVLARYVLDLDLMVPGVDDPAFALPLTAKLIAPDGRVAGTTVISQAGSRKVTYPMDGMPPGNYRLLFDKAFSTKADPRKLSAMFVAATLRHVVPVSKNEGESK